MNIFLYWFQTHIEKGNDLLDEASMLAQSGNFEEATGYKELARTLKKHLQSFTSKLEDTREQIERTAKCYQLLDKVSVCGVESRGWKALIRCTWSVKDFVLKCELMWMKVFASYDLFFVWIW